MKNLAIVLLGIFAATTAVANSAAAGGDAGFYGQLDLSNFPNPQLINAQPTLIESSSASASSGPVYLHVPAGHEQRWRSRCYEYKACAVPVFFVTEKWYVTVYLPTVGQDDGREQRYLELLTRERSTERDIHDVHGED